MPKANKSKKTWRYTNEFKAKAVQLSLLEQDEFRFINLYILKISLCVGISPTSERPARFDPV
jgi:transposase-like protein